MSEAKTLTTLFPTSYELPLAGRLVRAGKLKLRQKAELQAWLDGLPEPNERVKAALAESKRAIKTWPISLDDLPVLLDEEPAAKRKFLQVALGPFNPGMSADEITAAIDDCDSDDEIIGVMLAAMYGIDPKNPPKIEPEPEATPQKKGPAGPSDTSSPT